MSTPRFPFMLGTAFTCVMLASTAHADFTAEADKKYSLQVVLSVAEHRMLTKTFKDRLQRELRDSLQTALGDLATVKVDTKHSLSPEIEAKGMDSAVDGATGKLFEGKSHFVRVFYADGRYHIRTRQLDGLTGLASPVLRREETTDPSYVARTTALLIGKDFGAVGTVESPVEGTAARVTLKAGKLGQMSRWVKKGDVFSVVQVGMIRGEVRAEPVPWALLQAEEEPNAEGVLRCRLWQRYKQSLGGGSGILGYRCMKLGTTKAVVRLRLVDEKTRRPMPDESITVRSSGFDGSADEDHASDADGFVVTRKEYENLAFIQVLSGAAVRARIPVPVLDDRAIIISAGANPAAEARGQFDLRRRQWIAQLYESLLVVDDLFKTLNQLVEAKEHDKALSKAAAGLEELKADIKGRKDEFGSLKTSARELGQDVSALAEGEERIKEMESRQTELEGFAKNLKFIKEATQRQAALLTLVEQARLSEGESEYGKAIKIYEKIVATSSDEPKINERAKVRLSELESKWTTRDDVKVQDFANKTWRNLEADDAKLATRIKQRIDEARKTLEACKSVKDYLTPRILLKANLTHATRLKKRLDALKPKDREDDRREAEEIAVAAEQLSVFTEAISTFLRENEKK